MRGESRWERRGAEGEEAAVRIECMKEEENVLKKEK